MAKNVSECRLVPCSISSACFPCFRGRSRQTVRQKSLRHGKIARRFCRLNEKRGQLLEALPFQSSKSWLLSFLASRLSLPLSLCACADSRGARLHFYPSSSIPSDTTFSTFAVESLMVINIEEGEAETRCKLVVSR